MSLVDIAIPLIGGIHLAACPQIFFKRSPTVTDEDITKKKEKLRQLGYMLLGVSALLLFTYMSSRSSRSPIPPVP